MLIDVLIGLFVGINKMIVCGVGIVVIKVLMFFVLVKWGVRLFVFEISVLMVDGLRL